MAGLNPYQNLGAGISPSTLTLQPKIKPEPIIAESPQPPPIERTLENNAGKFQKGINPSGNVTVGTDLNAVRKLPPTIGSKVGGFLGDTLKNLGGSMALGTGIASELAPKIYDEGIGRANNKLYGGNAQNNNVAPVATPTPAKPLAPALNPALGTRVNLGGTLAEQGIKPAIAQPTQALAQNPDPVKATVLADTPKINPLTLPKTNNLIPNQVKGLPDGVDKSLNANGNVIYFDTANQATANAAQNQPAQGYLTQPKRLSEDQVRQLYRELPADSFSAAGMGNTTAEQRYATQLKSPLNLQPVQDPNAQRNALTAQLNKYGNLGDKARRETAAMQLKMLDDKEQNTQNNLAKQQIADSEMALKAPLIQSEALRNQAMAQHYLTPPQAKPEYDIKEDGNGGFVRFNKLTGEQSRVPVDPKQSLMDKYAKEVEAANAIPDETQRTIELNRLAIFANKNGLS